MLRNFSRQGVAAVRLLLVFTIVLGIGYPLAGVALGAALDPQPATIGQNFDGPGWFQPRPSASDYDPMASGGSNLGPNNPDLVASIHQRRDEIAQREGVAPHAVPADAVTASASGLDPHISPAYARLQVARVARETGLSTARLQELIADATTSAPLGFLGADAVNVVELNAAVAAAQ